MSQFNFDTNQTRVHKTLLLEIVCIAALILLGFVFFGLTLAAKPIPIIQHPDTEDMAQIARHLRNEGVWATSFMPLNGLDYLRVHQSGGGWPSITRFPLMPFVFAIMFQILGESDWALVVSSGLFWLAGILLIYLFAKEVFSSYVAVLATVLYIASPNLREYSPTGLTEPSSAFFLLAMIAAIYKSDSWQRLVAGGVALGLGFLNRNNFAVFLIPTLLYIAWVGSLRRAAQFGVGFIPFLVIGTMYNLVVSGDPTFNLQASSVLPLRLYTGVLGWYELEYVSPLAFILQHPDFLAHKFISQMNALINQVLPMLALSPYILALALVAFFRPCPTAIHRLRTLVLSLFTIHAIFISAFAVGYDRMYVFFEPVAVVFVAGLLAKIGETIIPRSPSIARLGIISSVFAVLLFFGVQAGRRALELQSVTTIPFAGVEVNLQNLQYVQQRVKSDQIVASDLPWSIAWRINRRAIPLPPKPDMIDEVEKRYGLTISAIYIKTKGIRFPDQPPTWEQWRSINDSQLPGYQLDQIFPDGSVLFLKR